MTVYVLITPARVRTYGSHSRALVVFNRAVRMGIDVDFVQTEVKTGCTARQRKLAAEARAAWGAVHSCNAKAQMKDAPEANPA